MTVVRQLGRFSAVGVINTVVGLCAIYGLMAIGIHALLANVLGFLLGICTSYALNQRWTFSAASNVENLKRFIGSVAASYSINLLVLYGLITAGQVDPYIAQLPALAFYSVSFFFLCKFFVFGESDDLAEMLGTLQWPHIAVATVFVLPALTYLGYKSLLDPSDTIDFKYIWLAGYLWVSGENPYGPSYLASGAEMFAGKNIPEWWVYPPNWWPIASGFAALPYERAAALWRLSGGALLGFGVIVLLVSARLRFAQVSFFRQAAFVVLVSASTPTAVSLSLGQTSPLLFLGTSLFACAWLTRNRHLMVLAVVLLAFKPNVCLVLCALLLTNIFWWPSLLLGGFVTLTLAAPAFVAHGYSEILHPYLELIRRYSESPVNSPQSTTGLRNLLHQIGVSSVSPIMLNSVGVIVLGLLGYTTKNRNTSNGDSTIIALAIVLVALLVPLHTYDMVVLFLLIILAVGLQAWVQLVLAVALAVVFREANLAIFTGLFDQSAIYFPGSFLVSIAILAMAASLAWQVFAARHP